MKSGNISSNAIICPSRKEHLGKYQTENKQEGESQEDDGIMVERRIK